MLFLLIPLSVSSQASSYKLIRGVYYLPRSLSVNHIFALLSCCQVSFQCVSYTLPHGICAGSGCKWCTISSVSEEVLGHVWSHTSLGVHWEVRLALQDAVDHTSTVTICGVVGICGGQLDHRCSCANTEKTWEQEVDNGMRRRGIDAGQLQQSDDINQINNFGWSFSFCGWNSSRNDMLIYFKVTT